MFTQYEHHIAIRQNKLCPFFLRVGKNLRDTTCNWHQNIEILLITGGSGHVKYGTEEHAISRGDVVVINSGTVHRIYSKDGISYYCVIIDEQFCADNGLETSQTLFREIFRDEITQAVYLRVIEEMQKKNSDDPITVAKTRQAVLSLLIDLFEKHTKGKLDTRENKNRSDEHVKAVLSYMNEHYSSPITLDDIAEAVGISKYHLEREFKKYTDQTIFTYLNTLRCKNAELCIQNGMTVTQAAFENGFETLSYFSRTYKRLMGHPPSKGT